MIMNEIIPWISLGGFVISLLAFYMSRHDKYEKRFDRLEQTIMEHSVKVDLMWGVIENEFPKFLHRDDTPEFDAILENAKKHQNKELLIAVNAELEHALDHEDGGRAAMLAFYRTVVEYNLREEVKGK